MPADTWQKRFSIDSIRAHLAEPEAKAFLLGSTCAQRRDYISIQLLRNWFGDAWVENHVLDARKPYFRHGSLPEHPPYFQSRLNELAELLFNLQHVTGFEYRLEALQRCNQPSDIVGAIGELQGARLIVGMGVTFEFHGDRSYEGRALIGDRWVGVEMKAKEDGRPPRAAAAKSAVQDARDQLPTDRPNLCMLKVPDTWMTEPSARASVLEGIDLAFETAPHINAVAVHWESWRKVSGGDVREIGHELVIHPEPSWPHQPLIELGQLWPHMRWSKWQRLEDVVCTREELIAEGWSPAMFP